MLNSPALPPARGQHSIRTKGSMSLICWYNKGHFRFLTNAYSPVQQGGHAVGAGAGVWVSSGVGWPPPLFGSGPQGDGCCPSRGGKRFLGPQAVRCLGLAGRQQKP